MAQGLTDIDSLFLAVRDAQSKALIADAITAYRGGALRSAIVATWIAVDYDIIAKARELAVSGDAASGVFITELDNAIESRDVKKLQKLEGSVLRTAGKDLQLLTHNEYEDLDRLQRDRHLCAHPAFTDQSTLFQPMPELVRAHIVHALRDLLVNAPLQGKAAIKRFHADLLSPSFPTDADEIGRFIRTKYLDRAKEAMVVNLIKSLLTAPFGNESDHYIGRRRQIARTLHQIAKTKTAIYDATAKEHVASKFESIGDELLLSISAFIECDARIWDWLPESTRIRFCRLLLHADADALKTHSAFDVFDVPELAAILVARFDSFDREVQVGIISQNPRREFIDTAIRIYGDSSGWRTAEQRGQALMVPLAPLMSADDVKAMLDAVKHNSQIYEAAGTPDVLEQVFALSASTLGQTKSYWRDFVDEMTTNNQGRADAHYSYPTIRAKLDAL